MAAGVERNKEGTGEYKVMSFKEERLGPADLDARGDRCMSTARRRRGWSFAVSWGFEEAAYSYVLAENCRLCLSPYSPEKSSTRIQRAGRLRPPGLLRAMFSDERELNAASALLRSARCYMQIEDKEEGEVAATKHALEKAVALLVKKNHLCLAATGCVELAQFYMLHQQLQNALDSYEQAADYYGAYRRANRYCRFKANMKKYLLLLAKPCRIEIIETNSAK
uniref:Uncharacterized protein n=1 Tax=Setaria italica TaxID=4555 RepID=K3YY73_SETIT